MSCDSVPRGAVSRGFALALAILVGCGVLLLLASTGGNEDGLGHFAALTASSLRVFRRRLVVTSPSLSLQKPSAGNLPDVPSSSGNVAVVAGPTYASLTIQATSGLGNNGNVRVKLVASTATDCSAAGVMGASPLDGSTAPSIRTASLNSFSNVRFTETGVFKICYKSDTTAAYELLQVTITASGGVSSNNHFCAATSGTSCILKLVGSGLGNLYKIGLIPYAAGASCGTTSLDAAAFNNPVSELVTGSSTTSSQVHSFSTKKTLSAATYLLCLCPNFDSDNSGGSCQASSSADFAQPLGRLFVTTVSANVANIYSGLDVNLTVNCGSGVGGCSAGTGNRYKIVAHSIANNAPAWNSTLGCGGMLQSTSQLRPSNCESSVMCQHNPEVSSNIAPTWHGVALRSGLRNARYVTTVFDVCYCDSNCLTPNGWFKVGEIRIQPISVGGLAIMNTMANVWLRGRSGSWTTTGNTEQREMKIFPDFFGAVTDKQCYEGKQSTKFVQGHDCQSTTDCAPPISGAEGQTYIGVAVSVPGWVAVCYCDKHCSEHGYWMVQGHILVAGPISGQTWFSYTNVIYDLEVLGWILPTGSRIRVIDWSLGCQSLGVSQDVAIAGPSPVVAQQLSGAAGSIASIRQSASQTKISFATSHSLKVGARISITYVTCAACTSEDLGRFNANHQVLAVLSSTELLVALTFPVGSYPTVDTSAAKWLRDDSQTFKSVRASAPGRYNVCWRAGNLASFSLSAWAGTLVITSAPLMPTQLYLSTIEPSKVAPIVVSFTTSRNNRYLDAVGPMQLKILFLEPSLLMPALFNGTLIGANPAHDSLEEASQSACSLWILELGTGRNNEGADNELGFPMPRGCYYRKAGQAWEFSVVFDPQSGLAPSSHYDIVMNARVGAGLTKTQEVIQVDSFDDSIRKRFDVVESGRAAASKSAASELRSGSDPEFNFADGFRILGNGGGSVRELLGSRTSFQARLRSATNKQIVAGNIIRLFARPFTQWIVGYSCFSSCTPYPNRNCGKPLCLTESVMNRWYHRNILRIRLPKGMANITHIVKHDLNITSLPTPIGGFFPLRWGVELQSEEGKKPHYVETVGKMLYFRPSAGVAAIVTRIGDGNLKPFQGQLGNTLYIKLMLGATLFASVAGDAYLRIVLPKGYSCIVGGGAPQNLGLLSGTVPSRNGNLSNGTHAPTWRPIPATGASQARCELRFTEKMVFYAGATAFFTISVDNPSGVLAEDAPGNRWALEFAAKGSHSSVITAPLVNFASAGDNLAASVSVLGKLTSSSIVPSDFARSSDSNWLSIFFTTAQAVASGGVVWVDSPSGFGVGKICQVKDLASYYYAPYDLALVEVNSTHGPPLTLRLPFLSCTGMSLPTSTSINRARIKFSTRLFAGASYGFMLRVTNPEAYLKSQKNEWRISTRSPSGTGIDGSPNSVQLNAGGVPGTASSWGMYEHRIAPSGFEVHIADMRPSGMPTKIRIFPIILRSSTNSPIRIIAPAGYAWNYSSSDFVYRKRAAGLAVGTFVPGVEVDMPISAPPMAPTVSPHNVLEIKNAVGWFRWGVKYGFEASIVVPKYTPTTSTNTFILQVGYNDSSTDSGSVARSQAAAAEAALVRRISDVVVAGFNSSIANSSNALVLRFRTVTDIPKNGGFVLAGPTGFAPLRNRSCHIQFVAGGTQILPLQKCRLGNFSGVGTNALASVLAIGAMPAGIYELHVPLQNPVNATPNLSSVGLWRVASYDSLVAPSPEIVDYEGTTTSFRINSPMHKNTTMILGKVCVHDDIKNCAVEDQQYRKTGRNDRPGAKNKLIFSVSLSASSAPGQFVIRAPFGFKWVAECTVLTKSREVFGAFNTLPAKFSKWPENATVSDCRGHDDVAVFSLSHPSGQGLLQGMLYVFRIDFVTNPFVVPADNLWTLDFSGQASMPFKGFKLWSISALKLTPHTTAALISNSVSLTFATRQAVPKAGYIQITAPGGFMVPTKCSLTISTVVPAKPWETDKLFLAGDFGCTGVVSGGQSTNIARIFLYRKSLLAGVQYVFRITVTNPVVTSGMPETWQIASFGTVPWITTKTAYEQLDEASMSGFPINQKAATFELRPIPKLNGLAKVRWQFSLSFKEAIFASDRVEMRVPNVYVLQSSPSSTQCSQYELLVGLEGSSSSCVGPCYQDAKCVNSTMVWSFHRCPSYKGSWPWGNGLCLRDESPLQFALATTNPAATPASNFFFVKHVSTSGAVESSMAISAYPIVPLLESPKVELVAAGALGVISEAVGSESSIRVTFTPTGAAQTVTIQGGIKGDSFRFSTCLPKDDASKVTLLVNEREYTKIIVTLPKKLEAGKPMSILLSNMGNPAHDGVSSWNITTYQYYDLVLGPRIVVNQKTGIAGLEVLGYISVLTTSTLRPKHFGKKGATLALNFKSSVLVQRGDEVVIVSPRNYAFDSNLFNVTGALVVADLKLVGPGSGPASALLGSYVMVDNVTAFQATYLSSGFALSDMTPIYKKSGSSSYLYKVPGGKQWAIGPVPGKKVLGAVGEGLLSGSDLVGQVSWQVGGGSNGSTWSPAPNVYATAIGTTPAIQGSLRQLTLRLGAPLAADATGAVVATLSLPLEEQKERNWRISARRITDSKVYATNDMQYSGFSLLWEISFEMFPSLTAPKAQTSLTMAFDQERRLSALKSVRYELTAPLLFRFPASCLSVAERQKKPAGLFAQCVGSSNVATMVATDPSRIKGRRDTLRVELTVLLPAVTPLTNSWTLAFYLDASSVNLGYGEAAGFSVKDMSVSFKGSNQLSLAAPAYFTIRPWRTVKVGSSIHISPPVGQRYEVSCYLIQQVNLPMLPKCSISQSTGALVLSLVADEKFGGGQLAAGRNYTMGIGITNAGRTIPHTMNLWGVVIYDKTGNIQDANYKVQGEQLRSIRMSVKNAIVSEKLESGTFRATVAIALSHDLAAGLVSELWLIPPSSFRITTDLWKVSAALPMPATSPPRLKDGSLVVPLSPVTLPRGRHSIQVTGSLDASGSPDSTWTFQARRGDEVMYQHVLTGFTS